VPQFYLVSIRAMPALGKLAKAILVTLCQHCDLQCACGASLLDSKWSLTPCIIDSYDA